MDENHQDKTESKLIATEDKSIPSSLSSQDQRGTDQLQKNQMEVTIKQLRDRGYKVTEEYSNTGLSKVSGEHPQRKTLWDWLQLLVIPLLIFFIGIGFTWVQNQTSLQIAKDNRAQDLQIAKDTQEEATMKAYLDDMTTLLLDKKLGSQKVADTVASAEAAVVAQAKTSTVLRRLTDGFRKATVVQFLYESHLIGYFDAINRSEQGPIIGLSGANLSGAELSGAFFIGAILNKANLSGAELGGADLRGTYLDGVKLNGADLRGANLSTFYINPSNIALGSISVYLGDADLRGAHLNSADLRGAILSGAHLNGADLRGAILNSAWLDSVDLTGANDLTQQQLDQVNGCKGAILPKGLICHNLNSPSG